MESSMFKQKLHHYFPTAHIIKYGECLTSEQKEAYIAFKRLCAEAGHLFEKDYTRNPITKSDCLCTMNHVSQFTFQPFSPVMYL